MVSSLPLAQQLQYQQQHPSRYAPKGGAAAAVSGLELLSAMAQPVVNQEQSVSATAGAGVLLGNQLPSTLSTTAATPAAAAAGATSRASRTKARGRTRSVLDPPHTMAHPALCPLAPATASNAGTAEETDSVREEVLAAAGKRGREDEDETEAAGAVEDNTASATAGAGVTGNKRKLPVPNKRGKKQ